jgi:hypothetical protein
MDSPGDTESSWDGEPTSDLRREHRLALIGVNRAAMARRAVDLLARTRQLTPKVTQEVRLKRVRVTDDAGFSLPPCAHCYWHLLTEGDDYVHQASQRHARGLAIRGCGRRK